MNMKSRLAVLAILAALAAPAAMAQPSFEVIGRATYVSATGEAGEFEDFEDTFSGDFDDEIGYGAAFNYYFAGPWSVEIGATFAEPDLELVVGDPTGTVVESSVEMIPITLGVQYHFNPAGRFDPYVGAGAGYVLFDDIDDEEALQDEDIGVLEFDDDVGVMVNAGLNIGIFESFAINIDAKYLDIEPDASAVLERGDFVSVQTLEFSPILFSAGVSWRF